MAYLDFVFLVPLTESTHLQYFYNKCSLNQRQTFRPHRDTTSAHRFKKTKKQKTVRLADRAQNLESEDLSSNLNSATYLQPVTMEQVT